MKAVPLLILAALLAGCSGGKSKVSVEEGNRLLNDRQTGERPASGASRRAGKE